MLAVGFASGFPFQVTADALQAWMTDAGVDLGRIGLFGLVALPYSLKLFWAPVMDRFVPPFLGRRRGWMLVTQVLLAASIAWMAVTGPSALGVLAVAALAVAFFSASQDIVIDAYRTDLLRADELGPGAAVFVTGYRLAVIAVGAGALALADLVPWPVVYLALAAAMAACVAATILSPEPEAPPAAPATLRAAVLDPFREFLRRPGGGLVLLFPLLFKAPDIVAGRMTLPFLLEIGFSKTEVAAVRQALGMGVTIVGTILGGGFVARFGIRRSLWVFGVLQAVSNLGFWVLAEAGPVRHVMIGVIAVENFCTGLVTAGYLTFLMAQCDHRYTATQFALLTSLGAVARDLGGAPVGYAAEAMGWPVFFAASVLAAIPGMLLIPWLRLREEEGGERRAPRS